MTRQIRFSKMHGLGNDFIVMDGIKQKINLSASSIQQLANRHTGVGFDQLLLIENSSVADFSCVIFNSDGSQAEQCGNGMRCVARFLQEQGLTTKNALTIETKAGIVSAQIHNYENIEVAMGIPVFDPKKIPFLASHTQKLYPITIGSETLNISVLSMGNPHAVLLVDHVKDYPVNNIGPFIEKNALFPQGVNVGFLEIVTPKHVRLRTFERGAGETLACGSNACAAVVAGIINHQLNNSVSVELTLGQLIIQWQGEGHPVIMSGPASLVFTGDLLLSN